MIRRLLLSYLTLAVIILIVLEIPLALFFGQREDERFKADAERDAVVLASFYTEALRSGDVLNSTMADSFANRTGVRVVVVDSEGISVIDTTQVIPRDYSTRPEIERALLGFSDRGTRHSDTLDTDLIYVAVPVASAGIVHGAVRLTVDAHEVIERKHQFWLGLVGVAVVVLLSIGGIGWAIARSVTRPLRELRTSAMRFAEGNLAATDLPKEAPAEIRELGETMNNMASRLEELIATQKAFVSDASHQLRTPLTALRLRLENIEAGSGNTPEMTAAIAETTRLSDLVEDLLRLARAESAPPMSVIDLSSVTRDRVETWTALAEAHQIDLQLVAPDRAVVVMANSGAIEQILDNLLDNALEVSSPGTVVTIRLEPRPGITNLTVSDQGPGLDDEGKTKALERFWRGNSATPGTGLGLAIAHALAVASGGDIVLIDNSDGGLSVVVSLVSSSSTPT